MADNVTDLEAGPVEELPVTPAPVTGKVNLQDSEFAERLHRLLKNSTSAWRSAEGLAAKMRCDPLDLARYLSKSPVVVSRPGQEDGKVFFALSERVLGEAKPKPEEKPAPKPVVERVLVAEEDRYAVAMLHQCYQNLQTALERYALPISSKSMDAFTHLTQAKDKLGAGLAVFAQVTRADANKLPAVR